MRPTLRRLVFVTLFLAASAPAWATADGAHHDPVAPIVGGLALMLFAAKAGGAIALRFRQPAVLGELLVGVVLGNLHHLGTTALDPLKTDPSLDMLARLGVLILLFEVGLESTVGQMLEVGIPSLVVAVLGVVAPFGLGWAVGIWLLPDHSIYVHAFLGATLCATSVGITARVLQDLDRSQTREARIILGAAVIDDVLGLIVLAVVSAVIVAANAGDAVSYGEIALVVVKAAAFLAASLWLGVYLSPRAFALASRLEGRGVLLAAGLGFCFLLAWAADAIGLAAIVGAFAAGLILEDVHYRDFVARGEHGLEELIRPIGAFLTPIFFVLMGARTDIAVFARTDVLALATALTAAAVIGKQACSLGVVAPGLDRLSVGLGMIPRGEVGLIFAGVGATLAVGGEKIVDEATFSAVVVMVIVTTMITPPALKWSLNRRSSLPTDELNTGEEPAGSEQ